MILELELSGTSLPSVVAKASMMVWGVPLNVLPQEQYVSSQFQKITFSLLNSCMSAWAKANVYGIIQGWT